jgi:esterase
MKLNYKQFGQGKPLIILHGLFGSLDNWQTLARQFSEHFCVYILDQRNHGQSDHDNTWNYEVMADDLKAFFELHQIEKATLLGHSMGGKTAMLFALKYPHMLDKLIVADIAPKQYKPHHQHILETLQQINFNNINSRSQVEELLTKSISDFATRQFLLKNLYWKDLESKKLAWRFNLDVISKNIHQVNVGLPSDAFCETPTLFIRGSKSDYITDEDIAMISDIFTNVRLETIEDAGHWLHAEKPELFKELVLRFALL